MAVGAQSRTLLQEFSNLIQRRPKGGPDLADTNLPTNCRKHSCWHNFKGNIIAHHRLLLGTKDWNADCLKLDCGTFSGDQLLGRRLLRCDVLGHYPCR